ncbi:hypothetical protein DFP72DRAFT_1073850 [Ephemerocybe angulata]|uniref:Uncharacterized protein n=1 Tax=Ephemerocybe angulata TaxID=980116 RepID=A0A8H6HMZ3_9AGAR|nr:hypothetical protein DFP72DRAFT_1073850 [Tulosesus angulatus]
MSSACPRTVHVHLFPFQDQPLSDDALWGNFQKDIPDDALSQPIFADLSASQLLEQMLAGTLSPELEEDLFGEENEPSFGESSSQFKDGSQNASPASGTDVISEEESGLVPTFQGDLTDALNLSNSLLTPENHETVQHVPGAPRRNSNSTRKKVHDPSPLSHSEKSRDSGKVLVPSTSDIEDDGSPKQQLHKPESASVKPQKYTSKEFVTESDDERADLSAGKTEVPKNKLARTSKESDAKIPKKKKKERDTSKTLSEARQKASSSSKPAPRIDIEGIEELNPDSAPVPHASEKYYLGLAMVNVVLPFCGGKGVTIEPFQGQRRINPAHVNKFLAKATKEDSGLRVMELANAIVLALPRASFDPASVTKDSAAAKPISWLPGADGLSAIRYAGTHRTAALKKHHDKGAKAYTQATTALDRALKSNQLKKATMFQGILRELEARSHHFSWLARIYDLEGIKDDPERVSIEMHLSSNTAIETLPENEKDALDQILGFVADIEEDDTYLHAVQHAIKTHDVGHQNIQLLLRRGPSLIRYIGKLRKYSSFDPLVINPTSLSKFNLYAWGAMEPVLKGCLNELFYLSSTHQLPAEIPEGVTLDPGQTRIVIKSIKDALDSPPSPSEPVLDCLVTASEAAFSAFDFAGYTLGSKSETYCEHIADYHVHLLRSVVHLIKESQLKEPEIWKEDDIKAAECLPRKLRVMQGVDYVAKAGWAVKLPGVLPVLCPQLVAKLVEMWNAVPKSLYMISNWFVPGLRYIGTQLQSHNKKAQTNPPFSSYTAGISFALAHHLGCGIPLQDGIDWNRTPPSEMLALHPIPGAPRTGAIYVNRAFNTIVYLLFENLALLQGFEAILPFMPLPDAFSKKEKLSLPTAVENFITHHAHPLLECWVTTVKAMGMPMAQVTNRHHHQAPESVTEYIKVNNDADSYLAIIADLVAYCPQNVLIPSSGITNRTHYHLQYARQILLEYEHFNKTLLPALEQHPQVSWLFHRMLSLLQKVPGFDCLDLWPNIPHPDSQASGEIDRALLEKKAYEVELEQRSDQFNKAFSVFVRSISRADCLGIPVEMEVPVKGKGKAKATNKVETKTSYHLHPVLASELYRLHNKGFQTLFDITQIEVLESLESWPGVPKLSNYRQEYWDAKGIKVDLASEDALVAYYREEAVIKAKEKKRRQLAAEKKPGPSKRPVSDEGEEKGEAKRRRKE